MAFMNRFCALVGVHTRGLIRQNFVCDKIMSKRLSNLAKNLTLYFECELSIQVELEREDSRLVGPIFPG